ncbi:two-component sensor histidine kinase [Chitinophaga alhagiae]|uniref:histidine kinase n=1 Tax=Chitinophaga alhagiae TaxID=2203219 RepID=A0ABM6WBY0_9BACT|nr:ATP-binding protein [Chitinophaga alhagiae]AWO01447.1 two-component sensor histidine kinase [Chitinophaga alhagiae]
MKKTASWLQSKKMITGIYVFVLAYTVLQLLWWGVLLHQQSKQIAGYERLEMTHRVHELTQPAEFMYEMQRLQKEQQMRTFKYVGEGIIFLVLILAGAALVYRAVWKQMKLSQQQQNFMMAVTHELKSPIAVAKLNLETLRKHRLDEEKQRKLLDNTLRETNRLDQLCNNILLASQFEHQKYQPFLEELNFSDILQQGVDELKDRTPSHTLTAFIQPGILLQADRFMMQLLLNNLVENAVKYAPKGTEIQVRLFTAMEEDEEEPVLKLEICDEGEGIAPTERKRIFEKFYRIGNENTRKSKGSGLGLYLAKKIVEQHGGAIEVMDNEPRGTCFQITWDDYSTQPV